MAFLEKFIERVAPAWMPYVYLFAFLALVAFTFVRVYVATRDMLNTNKVLGARMTAAEGRLKRLESDRDRLEALAKEQKDLLDKIHIAVLDMPKTLAQFINVAIGRR